MLEQLEAIRERFLEVEQQIAMPEVVSDLKKFKTLSKEYKDLQKIVDQYMAYQNLLGSIEEAKQVIATEKDEDFRDMAKGELIDLEPQKEKLEEEGVRVLLGVPNMKVHAKLCVIKKRFNNKTVQYGFVSTGNLNESTSKLYGDHCLLTANRKIMADINRIFTYLEYPVLSRVKYLRQCKTLVVCPTGMRRQFLLLIDNEIKNARKGLKASIILKMNSLSDEQLIDQLSEAAKAGVEIKLIVRGIFCMLTESSKFKVQPVAISIVDQYLEHSRVLIFHNNGKEKVYLSSADWMIRNLDHRIEAAVEITNKAIQEELKECINIQLKDNVKARILDNNLLNAYVKRKGKTVRSQVEIYNFLHQKILKQLETGRH